MSHVRALYRNGVFVPVEPVNLAEESEVEVDLSTRVGCRGPSASDASSTSSQEPEYKWDPEHGRQALRELHAMYVPMPGDDEAVGANHDDYLYGSKSEFAEQLPESK